MEGVHAAIGLDGAGRGHERLTGDLAPEDALRLDLRADAAEHVDLDVLEVEELDQLVDGRLLHRDIVARRVEPDARQTPAGRAAVDGSPSRAIVCASWI